MNSLVVLIPFVALIVTFFLPILFRFKLLALGIFFVFLTIINLVTSLNKRDNFFIPPYPDSPYREALRNKDKVTALELGRIYYSRQGYDDRTAELKVQNDIDAYIG